MALNYSIHPPLYASTHRSPSLPSLHFTGGEATLALNTDSATIVGPCELHLVPGEAVKLDVRALADAASLNPAASPLKLMAGGEYWFNVDAGSWKIKVSAA